MKEHHPDRASPEQRSDATRKSAEINAAYDFIIGLSESGEKHSASKTANTAGTTKSKADTKPNKTLCENCERQVGQTSKFCGFCGEIAVVQSTPRAILPIPTANVRLFPACADYFVARHVYRVRIADR